MRPLDINKMLLVCILSLSAATLSAQQDPEYTQYMYNMSVVNPAYATDRPVLNLGGLYRTQWVGMAGAPKSMTFFAHAPVGKKIEIGLSAISDDIGDGAKKENNVYADVAYVLALGGEHKLSFGIKAGFTSIETNFNGFRFESGDASTDEAFAQNINSFKPNMGAGVYYFTDNYYLGISVPNLLSTKHIEERDGINAFGSEEQHLFVTGGYVFTINDNFKFKPAFMTKLVTGSNSFDITANVLFRERFELGAAYRVGDAVSGLANMSVTPAIRIGYAYDYTLSNLGQFNSGTHEIFVLFDIYMLGKNRDKSPRFF